MLRHVPRLHPKPDAKGCVEFLLGGNGSRPVPLVEYLVDPAVIKPILEDLLGRTWIAGGPERESQKSYLDNIIAFWYRLGYDFVRFEEGLPFPKNQLMAFDPPLSSGRQRSWADEHQGSIRSWKDYDRYPWPVIRDYDFFPFEYLARNLPDGMGLVSSHAGGIFEHLSWIMSYEGLCFALKEDPSLVKAVSDRIGGLLTGFYEHLLDLPNLISIFPGDDMGYKTGPLISPADLKTHILPWHNQFARMAHDRGLPYFLHSCGNLESIMTDLIEDVGIDGKHSFEDEIMPVEEFQANYGNRVATLGGLDVDILARGSESRVRRRTRQLIETCGPRGRFAIGSGNSIPSYVPAANYLAMLDEALA